MPIETIIGAWVATGLTLFIFSFLYKDNPLFKLAENLYVGVSVGYTIVKTYDTVVVHLVWKPIVEKGEWALLIPVAIGALMLTRYVPKAAWLSRYAFAFIVGVGSGLAIPRVISSYILKQIEDTMRPIVLISWADIPSAIGNSVYIGSFVKGGVVVVLAFAIIGLSLYKVSIRYGWSKQRIAVVATAVLGIIRWLTWKRDTLQEMQETIVGGFREINHIVSLDSLVILVGVGCVLFYFFFSVEHTGPGKVVARTGILFLMIAFGAAFGYTVMARMSLLIGRLTDLIEFTDPSYGRPSLWLLGLTILTLVVMARRSGSKPEEE